MNNSSSNSAPAVGSWAQLLEDFAEGRLPVLETIKAVQPNIYQKGDHEGFVNFTCAMQMLMQDVRLTKIMLAEIDTEVQGATGKKYKQDDFERFVRSKDGPRLMDKLGTIKAEVFRGGPTLLPGRSFQECLSQYQRMIGYVESLWNQACDHYRARRYPLCTFFSVLTIEEIGKLGRLWYDLLAWDRPLPSEKNNLGILGRDHRKKHFIGVISGAVVNARLDRVLGRKPLKQLLQDVDSGKLETLRQSCLYIDLRDGHPVTPDEIIPPETAKFFAVLAGELWAEVLGHFPWEFEMMQEKVIAFELEIGFPAEIVHPN